MAVKSNRGTLTVCRRPCAATPGSPAGDTTVPKGPLPLFDSPQGEEPAQPRVRCHSAVSSRRRHRIERRKSPIPLTTVIREVNRAGPHEWKSELQVRVRLDIFYQVADDFKPKLEGAVKFACPGGDILLLLVKCHLRMMRDV